MIKEVDSEERSSRTSKQDGQDEFRQPSEKDQEGICVRSFRPPPLEILNHVKINVEAETPISTLKGILGISSSEISCNKAELRTAEEKMTKAFVSFHHKLRLLKSYW